VDVDEELAEALLAIAQIALGLAGFGGVFVAVGRGGAAERRPADTYRLVLLLTTALATLALSFLPVTLRALGLEGSSVWRLASALLAAVVAALLFVFRRWRLRYLDEIREGEAAWVATGVLLVFAGLVAAELLNAAGAFGARAAGVFFVGLVSLVTFGSYLFARMLFLWRS